MSPSSGHMWASVYGHSAFRGLGRVIMELYSAIETYRKLIGQIRSDKVRVLREGSVLPETQDWFNPWEGFMFFSMIG